MRGDKVRSFHWIAAPLSAVALFAGACSDDGSADGASTTEPAAEGNATTTAEATAEPTVDCALSVEEATELSGMQIDVVDSRATGVDECQYFQGTSENSAPMFRYSFRPGTLQEKDGEPLTVAGSDARYKQTTGTLLVQVGEGELLDVKGYALQQQNLVGIGEAIVAAQ